MGTVVLLPQDCLRSRSRHKHETSGMIYAPECAPRSKRNLLASTDVQEAGLLPLPVYGRHSFPMNIPRNGSDTSHFKFRKAAERGERNLFPKVAPVVPVYKILQRPKQGDDAVKLMARFVMVDEYEARSVLGMSKNGGSQNDGWSGGDKPVKHTKAEFQTSDAANDGSKLKGRVSDIKVVKGRSVGGSACQPKDVSRNVIGMHTSTADGYKLLNMKGGASKPKVVTTDKVHNSPDGSARAPAPLKLFSTKAAGKAKDIPCKAGTVRRSGLHESIFPKGSTCLRRTSTDPQIPMHILGQYQRNLAHITLDSLKPESQSGLSVNSPFSCPERWAGPAYTSSPSPSSVPLPKLCLPRTRFSSLEIASLEIPSLVKQYSTSVYMQPFLGSSAPSENGGAWDVAFATRSLRKILHLDPC